MADSGLVVRPVARCQRVLVISVEQAYQMAHEIEPRDVQVGAKFNDAQQPQCSEAQGSPVSRAAMRHDKVSRIGGSTLLFAFLCPHGLLIHGGHTESPIHHANANSKVRGQRPGILNQLVFQE